MIRWLRGRRAAREAERQQRLALIRALIAENERRLAELKRWRETPCDGCGCPGCTRNRERASA